MSKKNETFRSSTVELLFAEFNEVLRMTNEPDFAIANRCPEDQRAELVSLMNVAVLAFRAFAKERAERLHRPARAAVS
jgi:hypothetical protein